MKNISLLPRAFNIIGIILIFVSLILIVIQLVTLASLPAEYMASVCFIGILMSIFSKGDEQIKYKAVFISATLNIVIKTIIFPLSNVFALFILYVGLDYMAIPVMYLGAYFILKYLHKQKS